MRPGSNNGFTLIELTSVCIIVFVLFVFLLGYTGYSGGKARQASGASNQKQIALAFLQYEQDYDLKMPPVGYLDEGAKSNPTLPPVSWGPEQTLPGGKSVPGILSPYTKSNALFVDPDQIKRGSAPLTTSAHLYYMYNDLVATKSQAAMSAVSQTVIITESEDRMANFGHAYSLLSGPFDGEFNAKGNCDAGHGASIRSARTCLQNGANFAFADGHVRWFVGGPDDPIFFPPRASACPSAVDPKTNQQIGPIPGGDMRFEGRTYEGTFQLSGPDIESGKK